MRIPLSLACGAALLGVTSLGLFVSCGEAQAEPLDVTYYYLPG